MRMNLDCDNNEFILTDTCEKVQVVLRYHNKLVDVAILSTSESGYMTTNVARWLQKAIGRMLDRAAFIVNNCKNMDTRRLAHEVLGTDF